MIHSDFNARTVAHDILGLALLTDMILFPEIRDELIGELKRRAREEHALFHNRIKFRAPAPNTRIARRVAASCPIGTLRIMADQPELLDEVIRQIDAAVDVERVLFEQLPLRQRSKKIATANARRTAPEKPRQPTVSTYQMNLETSTDTAIYNRIRKLIRAGLPVPAEMDAEMSRRNPRYNPKTHRISHPRGHSIERYTDYTKSSTQSLSNSARGYFARGHAIPPALMRELKRRRPNVDTTTGRVPRKRARASDLPQEYADAQSDIQTIITDTKQSVK